jgi:hypothetical protein
LSPDDRHNDAWHVLAPHRYGDLTMTAPLDMGTEFGARAVRRLREDMTAWLTSTDRAGTPQPAPVWFLWNDDDSSALVYS